MSVTGCIANEHGISTCIVYRGFLLAVFGVPYPTDMIPIPMGDVCVIARMDWMSRFGAMIDCKGQ